MKKILIASVLLLGTALATYKRPEDPQYPFVIWSKTAVASYWEDLKPSGQQTVVDKVKETLISPMGELKAQRMYILRKEQLTTRDLLKNINALTFDSELMMKHSLAFADVADGFGPEAESLLETALSTKTHQYSLHNPEELPALIEALAAKTEPSLRVEVINIRQSIDVSFLNEISRQLQVSAQKQGLSYVMAIAGTKGAPNGKEPLVNLQQTASITTTT